MKIVYVTDLHGDLKQYTTLKQLVTDCYIELLLIGGDLLEYSKNHREQVNFIENF
jgi:Icc-related predicted phosphoesterase